MMNLSIAAQQVVLIMAMLISLHLVIRFIRDRTVTDFILLIGMLLFAALFLMEILFLKYPFLDFLLAVIIGVIAGLHLLRLLRFRS